MQVSWHDTDANRCVRPSKILEYMQETANRQCEDSGLPLDALRDERGLAFILGALSMNIYAPLHAYEEIEVRTWCKEAKSYIFMRYFEILRGAEKIAEASTTWVLLDIESRNMVKARDYDFLQGCFYYDEPVDPTLLLPKPRFTKDIEMCEIGKRKIVYSDIDYNAHMNNTRYPDMLCDFLPEMLEQNSLSALSLSYVKEAQLGACLTVERCEGENGTLLMRTRNESGETCLEAILRL